MKKIILGSVLCFNLIHADVSTIKPYTASISYDSNVNNSIKDKGLLSGVYYTRGNLDYLLELDVAYTNIEYKDSTANDDIKQVDMTLIYSKFYKDYMLKGGLHYLNTTDTALGNGITLIAGISKYAWKYYDKMTSGVDLYYTKYSEANVAQLSPYFVYSKAININTRNNVAVKVNYVYADTYTQKDYMSLELTDTLFYKKFTLTTKAFYGEMKSGILDGGFTIFNTKDLIKSSYSMKLGYSVNKNLSFEAGYAVNNFVEDGMTTDTKNNVAVVSATYSF
jgi:hypothetical protein